MRVPRSHLQRSSLDLPMAPMIDVVFQLLIFFMCTTSFHLIEELLPTSLAVAGGASVEEPIEVEPDLERVIVRGIYSDGQTRWLVNDRHCDSLRDVEAVLHAVAEVDLSLPVILDVAGRVPLGDMIDVYDLCRLTGFEKIQFAAEREL